MNRAIEEANRQKLVHALDALEASLKTLPIFDPIKKYNYQEMEGFDALTSRFIRAYESSIDFFRSYNLNNALQQAETLRDLLHFMEKAGYIIDIDRWFDMRLIRNKVTHDYLPAQVASFYELIRGPFARELEFLKAKLL